MFASVKWQVDSTLLKNIIVVDEFRFSFLPR